MSTEIPVGLEGMKTVEEFVAQIGDSTGPGYLLRMHPIQVYGGLIPLDEGLISAGRDEQCELHIEDPSVSRHHAALQYSASGMTIKDCGSTNGTFLNENAVGGDPEVMVPGDLIRIGNHVFKYLSANDIETQYHEAAYTLMTRDGLTGVLNKKFFVECFDREISRAIRRERSLGLALFDIDHFKSINDNYGHLAGDEVLLGVCQCVREQVRSEDYVARLGGEEFAVLLPEETNEDASAMAERLCENIAARSFKTCSGLIGISISLGVMSLDELDENSKGFDPSNALKSHEQIRNAMLQLCDTRLYRAKQNGRNQVCNF